MWSDDEMFKKLQGLVKRFETVSDQSSDMCCFYTNVLNAFNKLT